MTDYRCDIPILLLVYNRPETTRQAVEAIRAVRPSRLYVAGDGPRQNFPGDAERCEQARGEALKAREWGCEVRTLFREENLGCRRAVSGAIDWFFGQEERGIVLEDDCVATPSFYRFCEELLSHYSGEERVMTISGHTVQPVRRTGDSYYFSRYMHSGAWATWRRAWQSYETGMESWERLRGETFLEERFDSRKAVRYWQDRFDRVREGKIDSWAYIWQYSIWKAGGINILPEVNLVKNIGFGEGATNTKGGGTIRPLLEAGELEFPLRHPNGIRVNRKADRYTQFRHYQKPLLLRIWNRLRGLMSA